MKDEEVFAYINSREPIYFVACIDYKYCAMQGEITSFGSSGNGDTTYTVSDFSETIEDVLCANEIFDNQRDADDAALHMEAHIK